MSNEDSSPGQRANTSNILERHMPSSKNKPHEFGKRSLRRTESQQAPFSRSGVPSLSSPRHLLRATLLRVAVLSVAVLSVITISGCSEANLPAGEKEFAEGVLALELGDTASAHILFAQAEQNDPARPWRTFGAAKEIELYSSPFGATKTYFDIMSLTPDFDSAYTAYCRLALQNGKSRLAWDAVQLYARNRGVTDASGSGANASARRNYDLIVAGVLQLRGEVEKAESRLQDLSNSVAHDGEVEIALASVILQQGRVDEALSLVESALADNDERRDVVVAAIDFYIDAGYADKATALLELARKRENPKNIWANNLAIRTFLRLGYVDYASFTLSQMKIQGIAEGHATYLSGTISEAIGNSYQAKERYLYSLPLSNRNMELFRDAARAATSAGNFIQMENNMKSFLLQLSKASYPTEYIADAHLQFAEFYAALLQWRPAITELQSARSIFAKSPRFELLRARTLYSMQAKDSANALFTKMTAKNRSSFEWQRGLALTFAMIGEFESADVHVTNALEMQPNDFVSLVAKVDISRKAADSAGYAEAVDNLVRKYPRNKRTMRIHSDYYLSLGDDVSALDIANRMIELYPGDLSAYNYAASVAGSRYGSGQGLKYLTDAQAKNSKIPAPYRKLSAYHLRTGAIDSAEFFWAKANSLDSTDIATLLTRGVLLEARGFPDSAISVYKRIVQIDPFSADAYNNLAWVMANNDLEPATASNIAREAIALSGGGNGNMHGTLGWALFKEDKYPEANASMLFAIKFDPSDPFKRFMYGSILEEWGKKDEASEQFQQALDLGITGGYRKVVEEALSRLKG
jgi:tetratricopeptide (TPR) repeat protein